MNELLAALNASDASPEVKQEALKLALEISVPIVLQVGDTAAIGDGKFLQFLTELLKVLLPLLLELLKPKT